MNEQEDMATMPVRKLIASFRKQMCNSKTMSVIHVLIFNMLINRLEQEADRADDAEKRNKYIL